MSTTAESLSATAPEPVLRYINLRGARFAYFERNAPRSDLPTLLFVHATGFHGRIWDYIIEAFPEHHSIAWEQRGHGRSEDLAIDDWHTMGEDLAAFITAQGLSNIVGVGHSMGAHAMLDAAAATGAFARLVLCDPTIAPPEAYDDPPQFGDALHPAAKRQAHFASPEEMLERLTGKGSFDVYHPRMFRDYCEHGLLEEEGGGYRLACLPETEARVYMSSRSNKGIFDAARTVRIPVTILRARRPAEGSVGDFSSSPTWPGLVRLMPRAREFHYCEVTHFIPMQIPQEVIRIIREEIGRWRLAD